MYVFVFIASFLFTIQKLMPMPSTTAWAWKFLVLDLGQKVGQFYGNGNFRPMKEGLTPNPEVGNFHCPTIRCLFAHFFD